MTNKRKWLGILAIVLVFGLMVAGCDDSDGGGGYFTLTGIPTQYNGMFASLSGPRGDFDYPISGYNPNNPEREEYHFLISNGSVRFPIYYDDSNFLEAIRYSGNNTFNVTITIEQKQPPYGYFTGELVTWRDFLSVQFTNGSATRAWSTGRQ